MALGGEKPWEEDDSSAIVEIARREGKRVDLFRNTKNPQPITDQLNIPVALPKKLPNLKEARRAMTGFLSRK